MRVAGYGLRDTGCRLQVAGCRLQVAGCGLRVAGCGLQVAGCPAFSGIFATLRLALVTDYWPLITDDCLLSWRLCLPRRSPWNYWDPDSGIYALLQQARRSYWGAFVYPVKLFLHLFNRGEKTFYLKGFGYGKSTNLDCGR